MIVFFFFPFSLCRHWVREDTLSALGQGGTPGGPQDHFLSVGDILAKFSLFNFKNFQHVKRRKEKENIGVSRHEFEHVGPTLFKSLLGACVVPNFAVSGLDSNVMQYSYLSYCGQRYWFSFVV